MIEQEPKPGSADIDLWIASEAAIQARYGSEVLLSAKDWNSIDRFRLEAARNAAISSRVLLRVALTSATGSDSAPETWEFDRTELEKPFVERGPKLHFSISHAGPLIAIAVSQSHPIGVDIEPAPPRTSLEGMEHYLHANERRVSAIPSPQIQGQCFPSFLDAQGSVREIHRGRPESGFCGDRLLVRQRWKSMAQPRRGPAKRALHIQVSTSRIESKRLAVFRDRHPGRDTHHQPQASQA